MNTTRSNVTSKSAKRNARRKAARSRNSNNQSVPRAVPRDRRWELNVGPIDVGGFGKFGGASLKTGRALRSMQDPPSVGLSEFAEKVQVEMPRLRAHSRRPAVDVCRGTEYLGSISVGTEGAKQGDILSTILINPRVFEETRLKQLAALYQRYRFTRAHIIYQGDANATQSGSVIGFMDYDVDSRITVDDPLNVNIAAAQFASQPNKVWQSQRYVLGQLDSYTDLFINAVEGREDRLVYQGVWYLIAATEMPVGAIGTIYLDYEVEFSIPSLENIDQEFSQGLNLIGSSVGTVTAPFGSDMEEGNNGSFPPSNMEYTYTPGVGNSIEVFGLRKGLWLVWSDWSGAIAAGSGAQTVQTIWEIVSPSGVEWTPGSQSISYSNLTQSAATGQTASLVRTSFAKTFYVGSYTESVVLSMTVSPTGTGMTFNQPATFVLYRLPTPVGFPVLTAPLSRVFKSRRSKGVHMLQAKPKVVDIEDCHTATCEDVVKTRCAVEAARRLQHHLSLVGNDPHECNGSSEIGLGGEEDVPPCCAQHGSRRPSKC